MQDDVIAALDHAQIAEGPGGPAAMVPGQHHVRMNMYIAQARGGRFEVVESLGAHRSAGAPRRARRPSSADATTRSTSATTHQRKEREMLLATTQVEDFDRFMEVFSTTGADKRKQHGSKGVLVFRDPTEEDRVWASSTGTERAGRASCPTPRSRRSSRRPDTRESRRSPSSPASAPPEATHGVVVFGRARRRR